jgi:hypothetical protein
MNEAEQDILRCRRCRQEVTAEELDRILWCEECVAAERRRAAWWGRGLAVGAVGVLALWIALVIRPAQEFRILWALVLIVAYALGARLANELVFGTARVRNRAGARGAERSEEP